MPGIEVMKLRLAKLKAQFHGAIRSKASRSEYRQRFACIASFDELLVNSLAVTLVREPRICKPPLTMSTRAVIYRRPWVPQLPWLVPPSPGPCRIIPVGPFGGS